MPVVTIEDATTAPQLAHAMVRMPPRTSARASSGAVAASSMVTTGMTGESRRMSAMEARVFMRSSSHREPSSRQQIIDLRNRHRIEISRNGMLQAGGRERELE